MSTKAEKRQRSEHKKREHRSKQDLPIDSKGKVAPAHANRSTKHRGPSTKGMSPMGAADAVKKAVSVPVTATGYSNSMTATRGSVHLNGTDVGKQVVTENIPGLVAFCQGVAFSVAKLLPSVFVNPTQAAVLTEFITPADLVAYNVVCVLAAFNDARQLSSSVSGILNAFDKNCMVLLPVAEYIRRRIAVHGAPNITRLCTYSTDLTISQGAILSPTIANELATNQFGAETNMNSFELWNYSIVAGTNQDYSAVQVPLTLNLIAPTSGRDSWFTTRFAAVASYITGLPLGKVKFCEIPRSTTDYSGFCGPENGQTWLDAKRCLAPGRHNVDLAMYLNPNAVAQYYPGLSYQSGVLPATMAFQGGNYGVTFGGGGSYYGQPVVPANATRVAEVTGSFNHILLSADKLPRSFFGKYGYHYCGFPIPQLAKVVNVPIDTTGIVTKMLQCYIAELASFGPEALALTPGTLNAIAAVAQACVVRKILTAGQFEHLISLSPNTLTNTWNVQALYPSTAYITSQLPVGWNNLLDSIGPVFFNSTMWIPSFGTTLPQSWSSSAGAAKYNLWSKFGFNSPAADSYPPLAVPWAATNTNPDLYRHPYVYLANPTNATSAAESYWYNGSQFTAPINEVTNFPDSTPLVQNQASAAEESSNPVVGLGTTYSYGATAQTAYSNALIASGRETNMVYQYAGANSAISSICNIGKLNVKTAKGYTIVPIQKYLGNRCMLATNLGTVANGNTRQIVAARFYADQVSGDSFANLAVLASFLENTVIQSNLFLTNPGIWLTAATSLNTQPVIAATRPAQLSAYTKAGYTVRLQEKESFSLWQQYAQDLAADGSAVNVKLKKMLSDPKRMGEYEHVVTATRVSEHEANGAAQTCLVDSAINSQFTYGSEGLSVEELKKEAALSRAVGTPTQEVAAVNAIEQSETLRSGDDSTAADFYNLGKGAWKGLKTIVPIGIDALKLGMMFV